MNSFAFSGKNTKERTTFDFSFYNEEETTRSYRNATSAPGADEESFRLDAL